MTMSTDRVLSHPLIGQLRTPTCVIKSDVLLLRFLKNRGGRLQEGEMQRLRPREWANNEIVAFGLE